MNQQTKGLDHNVRAKGCKYLCHLKIAELETGNEIELATLNLDYKDHKKFGWLRNTCDVIRPNEIMEDFIQDLGGNPNKAPKQLGRNPGDGIYHFWAGEQPKPIKYHLVEYKTDNGYHWVLFDKVMNELYDSWILPYNRRYINSINLIG
jgi:hypothetical protein